MDMKKYLHLFLDESFKHIKALFKMIEELKEAKDYDSHLINEIFRAFHSIKGMSSALGYGSIASISHSLEDIFHICRTKKISIKPEHIPLITKTIDLLYEKLACIKEKGTDDIEDKEIARELNNMVHQLSEKKEEMIIEELIIEEGPSAVLYFKPIPLAIAKAFVIIKRIKQTFPDTTFEPSYDDIKKGNFEGYLKLYNTDIKLLDHIKEHVSRESYINRVEYPDLRESEEKEKKPEQVPSEEISLDNQKEVPNIQRAGHHKKKIWLDAVSLDALISWLGQLYIEKSILDKSIKDKNKTKIRHSFGFLSSLIDRIYGQILNLRMVPFKTISDEFPFVVKMVSSRQNKKVSLSIKGENIEIDRTVLDELKNALIHILRNAVDHGIETPDERILKKKHVKGNISVMAERRSEFINIVIKDDGRGLDAKNIKKRALELNIIDNKQYETLSDSEAIMLITKPGFSVLRQASEISGRGVGMDIVKNAIESVGGRLIINTEKGLFTEFTLSVPLTMAIQEVVVILNLGTEMAFPSRTVISSRLVHKDDIVMDRNAVFLKCDGLLYPAYKLDERLNLLQSNFEITFPFHSLLIENTPNPTALIVDKILETRKVIIQKLPFPFNTYNFLSAVTINDYGKPMLIIDPLRLIRHNALAYKGGINDRKSRL